jgi:hypothetical protein
MALSKTTRDHDEIRKWAEARGAVPAEVAGTERDGEPGILRFEFPNAPKHKDDKLKPISWEEFFRKFDEQGLEFLFEEKTADGQISNFNKFVYPEQVKGSHTESKSSQSEKSGSGKKHQAA